MCCRGHRYGLGLRIGLVVGQPGSFVGNSGLFRLQRPHFTVSTLCQFYTISVLRSMLFVLSSMVPKPSRHMPKSSFATLMYSFRPRDCRAQIFHIWYFVRSILQYSDYAWEGCQFLHSCFSYPACTSRLQEHPPYMSPSAGGLTVIVERITG